MLAGIEDGIAALAGSPWLYAAVFALVVGDAFLVVLPSETVVVALGALAGATGSPALALLVPVAAVGAVAGDGLCFLLGRRVGIDRWRWQRRGRVAAALARTRTAVQTRTAVLIFTARYIPFARIAVNLSAGAAGVPWRRFLPLSAAAGVGWALYNTGVGILFGAALPQQPLLAIAASVAVAVSLGLLVDLLIRRFPPRRMRVTMDPPRTEEEPMANSVARVTTITARSDKSFDDAIAAGISRSNATLRNVSGAWVKDQKVEVSGGKITAWQVTLEVTFVLDD
jgi:membrane protein DedA with SNARE-associated domain/flavin-binding protein dodecin